MNQIWQQYITTTMKNKLVGLQYRPFSLKHLNAGR